MSENNSYVRLLQVKVNNPLDKFDSGLSFEVSFEVITPVEDVALEWSVVYIGSGHEIDDQVLDSVDTPMNTAGIFAFTLEVDPPNPSLIRKKDLLGVTAMLIKCTYLNREFIRVGYFVNNELEYPFSIIFKHTVDARAAVDSFLSQRNDQDKIASWLFTVPFTYIEKITSDILACEGNRDALIAIFPIDVAESMLLNYREREALIENVLNETHKFQSMQEKLLFIAWVINASNPQQERSLLEQLQKDAAIRNNEASEMQEDRMDSHPSEPPQDGMRVDGEENPSDKTITPPEGLFAVPLSAALLSLFRDDMMFHFTAGVPSVIAAMNTIVTTIDHLPGRYCLLSWLLTGPSNCLREVCNQITTLVNMQKAEDLLAMVPANQEIVPFVKRINRHILADKPRVTKFPILWIPSDDPEVILQAQLQQQQQQQEERERQAHLQAGTGSLVTGFQMPVGYVSADQDVDRQIREAQGPSNLFGNSNSTSYHIFS